VIRPSSTHPPGLSDRRRPVAGARRRVGRGGEAGGQATVELALCLPVVVLALLLVVQLALVARAQILVVHAAREGARTVAVDPRPGAAARAAKATPGLDPTRLRLTTTARGEPGSTVRATARYRAPTDVPLVGALVGDVTLTATVAARVEDSPEP